MKPSRKKGSNPDGTTSGAGNSKKVTLMKFKEEMEQKKKNDTVDAAKVYADFIASFEDPEDSNPGPTSSSIPRGFVRGKPLVPTSTFSQKSPPNFREETSVPSKNTHEQYVAATSVSEKTSSTKGATSGKKPRVIEEFMVELKEQQEKREGKLKQAQTHLPGTAFPPRNGTASFKTNFDGKTTSHEVGDPNSTNLYLGNISPKVNEVILCQTFGKFGPIASVKIMWPRNQEEMERERNCGFISFMDRTSAVTALNAMDGHMLLGKVLRVSWGKPITIPSEPYFDINAKAAFVQTGLPFNPRLPVADLPPPSKKVGTYRFVPPPSEATPSSQVKPKTQPEVSVIEPSDSQTLNLIHRVVDLVYLHGHQFEALLMQKEIHNPKFQFLYNFSSPDHVYYRWKLFSLLRGDSKTRWRTEPSKIFDEGPYFVPPPLNIENSRPSESRQRSASLSDSSDDSDTRPTKQPKPCSKTSKGKLTSLQRAVLQQHLDNLTTDPETINLAMLAFLERVGESEEAANLLEENFASGKLTPSTAIANVYLLSDILHNVNPEVPQAWRLRAELEKRAIRLFTHLHTVYKGIAARLRAENFRRTISAVFPTWEASLIFPAPFIHSLSNVFQYGTLEHSEVVPSKQSFDDNIYSKPVSHEPKQEAPAEDYDDVDGLPIEEAVPLESKITDEYDDVDGAPIDVQTHLASDEDMFA